MEQVRRLLADVSVAEREQQYLSDAAEEQLRLVPCRTENHGRMRRLLEEQGERQEALLEEMNKTMKELSKGSQKGKFGIIQIRKGEDYAQKEEDQTRVDLMSGVLTLI